jgi:hypothetical protein
VENNIKMDLRENGIDEAIWNRLVPVAGFCEHEESRLLFGKLSD